MKTVAVIGAGPAGLSAAYKLLSTSEELNVVLFEKESVVGGLSRLLEFEGGRVDIGGHRFFSKDSEVLKFWSNLLPFDEQGMLIRNRSSRILWNKELIRYPLQLDRETLSALGPSKTAAAIASYLHSKMSGGRIESLEDFYIDRFGRVLYELFFKGYTRKLWGVPASELSDDWGSQRVGGISLGGLVKSLLCGGDKLEGRSLTRSFWYPALGFGQLWDCLGQRVMELGGKILLDSQVD